MNEKLDFPKRTAHVDSVTVFAMCRHGHLYYDTGHPARQHWMQMGNL